MKHNLLKPFAMLVCFAMASFATAQAQTRGGGEDEGIPVEYRVSSEKQTLDTELPIVWSYPVEMPEAPYWVSYNPKDDSPESLRLLIEENKTNSPREARFILFIYHPAGVVKPDGQVGTTTGRTAYSVHIIQDAR